VTCAGLEFLDDYQGQVSGGHAVTRIYLTATAELVRVRARCDSYWHQSYAVAEVLTPDRRWTVLLEDLPDRWHREVHPLPSTARLIALGGIAAALATRAATLLAFTNPTPFPSTETEAR
jgi:hypothetical protein